jgi:hypothetical protein
MATNRRYMVSVRSSLRMEVPLAHGGRRLVDGEYVRALVSLANEKFSLNTQRIARFEALARSRVLDAAAATPSAADAQEWVLVVQKRDAKLYKDLLKVGFVVHLGFFVQGKREAFQHPLSSILSASPTILQHSTQHIPAQRSMGLAVNSVSDWSLERQRGCGIERRRCFPSQNLMWLDFQRRPRTSNDDIHLPLTSAGAQSLSAAVAKRGGGQRMEDEGPTVGKLRDEDAPGAAHTAVLAPGASQQRKNRRRQRAGLAAPAPDGGGAMAIPEQLLALAAQPGVMQAQAVAEGGDSGGGGGGGSLPPYETLVAAVRQLVDASGSSWCVYKPDMVAGFTASSADHMWVSYPRPKP